VKRFPYENETRIENCRYCTHNQMIRLVAGPQTDECREIGVWTIYFAIALGLFLTVFFVLLGILYYSVVMVALAGAVVVAYWAYLYYGPHWTTTGDEQAIDIQRMINERDAAAKCEEE
jgi:glucan phosphoethanolaminetransferase (alkaline phosphatase superfamily)